MGHPDSAASSHKDAIELFRRSLKVEAGKVEAGRVDEGKVDEGKADPGEKGGKGGAWRGRRSVSSRQTNR